MQLGKFISFEGGEGCGKSTQVKLLHQSLTNAGINSIATREPGGTEGAEAIRSIVVNGAANRWDPLTETLLMTAARRDHVKNRIQPAIESGTWVVCDRFIHSTLAYQGYGRGLSLALIRMLQNISIGRVYPCLTLILDLPPEIGVKRALSRSGDETRYEQMDLSFHKRLREAYLAFAKKEPERLVVLDANQDIALLHQQIIRVVGERFGTPLQPAQ